MTILESVASQTSVRAVLALVVIATASYLAVIGAIDGPSYLGLAIIVASYFFNKAQGTTPDSK